MCGVGDHQDFVLRETIKSCLIVYTTEKQEFLKLSI